MSSYGQSFIAEYMCLDSAGLPLSGDLANHTIYWSKDGVEAAATNAPSASTNIPGLYKIVITATEAECWSGVVGGVTTTVGAVIIPRVYTFEEIMRGTDGANTVAPDNTSIVAALAGVTQLIDGVIEANVPGAFHVQMRNSSGDPAPSVAVTAERKLDGGAFAAVTGTVTNTDENGVALFSYAAADVNGTGAVAFKFSATSADNTYQFFKLSVAP